MIVRFTRHGQPLLDELPTGTDAEFPPGDFPLSDLGRRQAACLGSYLKDRGFSGRVISSPYIRTVETASIVCEKCGLTFELEPAIQEKRCYATLEYEGMSLQQLSAHFPNISKNAVLPSSWLIREQEPPGECRSFSERVNTFLFGLVGGNDDRDVLLVGHGATVKAMGRFFCRLANIGDVQASPWNCSLSEFCRDHFGKWHVDFQNDTSFLPPEIVTSNQRRLLDAANI